MTRGSPADLSSGPAAGSQEGRGDRSPAVPLAAAGDPRLLWRCRRGMKELDLLLERFARERYQREPPQMKRAFERLLALPDPVLVELLLEGGLPPEPGSPQQSPEDPEVVQVAALVAAPGPR